MQKKKIQQIDRHSVYRPVGREMSRPVSSSAHARHPFGGTVSVHAHGFPAMFSDWWVGFSAEWIFLGWHQYSRRKAESTSYYQILVKDNNIIKSTQKPAGDAGLLSWHSMTQKENEVKRAWGVQRSKIIAKHEIIFPDFHILHITVNNSNTQMLCDPPRLLIVDLAFLIYKHHFFSVCESKTSWICAALCCEDRAQLRCWWGHQAAAVPGCDRLQANG